MIAEILVLQRKVSYPGELSPEIMAIVDEGTLMDNPTWWPEEIERIKTDVGSDADRWATMRIDVPDEAIDEALSPQTRVTPVTVTS